MGQDDFYGEQYGHTQSSREPKMRQYYPDGNRALPEAPYTQFRTIPMTELDSIHKANYKDDFLDR